MTICKIEDCAERVHGHGYCSRHYYWAREHGKLGPLQATLCHVHGCEYKASDWAEKLCTKHLHRARSANITEDQLIALVSVRDGKCWLCDDAGTLVEAAASCEAHFTRGSCDRCVRGWVCKACNDTLKGAGDDIDTLQRYRYIGTRTKEIYLRAIEYVQAGPAPERFDRLVARGFFA